MIMALLGKGLKKKKKEERDIVKQHPMRSMESNKWG